MPKLQTHPAHLGLGASISVEPAFSGMEWYVDYATRHEKDGIEGRLVAMYRFDKSWEMWEMHPHGAELVVCTEGSLTLIQEDVQGTRHRVVLQAGDYAINQPGVWHTAELSEPATALFITAGLGTQHRPVEE